MSMRPPAPPGAGSVPPPNTPPPRSGLSATSAELYRIEIVNMPEDDRRRKVSLRYRVDDEIIESAGGEGELDNAVACRVALKAFETLVGYSGEVVSVDIDVGLRGERTTFHVHVEADLR